MTNVKETSKGENKDFSKAYVLKERNEGTQQMVKIFHSCTFRSHIEDNQRQSPVKLTTVMERNEDTEKGPCIIYSL